MKSSFRSPEPSPDRWLKEEGKKRDAWLINKLGWAGAIIVLAIKLSKPSPRIVVY